MIYPLDGVLVIGRLVGCLVGRLVGRLVGLMGIGSTHPLGQ